MTYKNITNNVPFIEYLII